MQTVLKQGSIDKPLTFDVGLIQLSFIPVCSLHTCNISVKLSHRFALQCFSLIYSSFVLHGVLLLAPFTGHKVPLVRLQCCHNYCDEPFKQILASISSVVEVGSCLKKYGGLCSVQLCCRGESPLHPIMCHRIVIRSAFCCPIPH